ncbi:lytic transglycosylase domain-containing protein [Rhodobacter sp. KR11]|uniref:lytic transglycosylase domain-containing protein n=1 Tax=Rhodobacter sp. KR11 TaxID=2974588 RepID=UPI00222232D0|nr:lytic transglycosylase domain-containing protein [Rhodobacter sp. KR11]MCW1918386.1 lytic transglycosylase domain-containing protein [Rhodobacter sp. KR11]
MTRIIPIFSAVALAAILSLSSARADEASALAAAQRLADAKDWPAAAAVQGTTAATIIEWQRLRAGDGKLGDYEAFLARHPDWPGLPLLREKGEAAVARSSTPDRVIAYFGAQAPATAKGALALAAALQAKGQKTQADEVMTRAWIDLEFTAEDQAAALAAHGPALQVAHDLRLDRLLWAGDRAAEAARMLDLVSPGWQALARARIALRADREGVTALVKAIPAPQAQDPGLAFDRFLYRMRHDSYADAATLILERSTSARALGDPKAWADKRASLTRWLIRNNDPKTAYRVAASHQLTALEDRADLEFLAGFIALRKLGDPARALTHFQHLTQAGTAITKARGYYWMARAQEAMGDPKAKASYQEAARHQTSYYGLLAAEKLGLSLDKALVSNAPPPGDWQALSGSTVLQAARLLASAGNDQLSARFLLHMAESLSDAQLGALAAMSLKDGHYRSAVLLAKAAAERGTILPGAYFPIPDMVPDQLRVSRALALAIARRESEFDPRARSSAGALGLMQVLPTTGAKVAKDIGIPHSESKLGSDPAYNVQIGAAYLREMADQFGPSVALIASGYNAGPRRPAAWIEAFGDPRSPSVDVVDWVETIPFTETRTYVMRVTEGVVIYRAKLKGASGPVRITTELTGR